MEARRRLKKIGGSVALFIPKEMLADLRMGPDTEVEISSEGTSLRIQRAEQGPPDGYQLEVGQQDLEDFAVSVAEGTIDTTDIVHWFENHSSRRT